MAAKASTAKAFERCIDPRNGWIRRQSKHIRDRSASRRLTSVPLGAAGPRHSCFLQLFDIHQVRPEPDLIFCAAEEVLRLAIFADIHANRPAFAACLEAARAKGAERIVCLGDIVGYGADPEWAVDTVMELAGG